MPPRSLPRLRGRVGEGEYVRVLNIPPPGSLRDPTSPASGRGETVRAARVFPIIIIIIIIINTTMQTYCDKHFSKNLRIKPDSRGLDPVMTLH